MRIIFLFLLFLFGFQESLSLFAQTGNNKTIDFKSPPFSYGNLSFPVSGQAIFGSGCGAFKNVNISEVERKMTKYNTSSFIMIVEYDSSDSGCFPYQFIFQCQDLDWCSSVVMCEGSEVIAGRVVWQEFDKVRSRSEFKVPLVEAIQSDCNKLKNFVNEAISQDVMYNITINHDPNLWEEMFASTVFLIYFRILPIIWSTGCLFLALSILKKYNRSQQEHRKSPFIATIRFRLTFKTICLLLQVLNHISRILYFGVDPIFSQRTTPLLPGYIHITASTTFDLGTHILLSFVIRELTQATGVVNMRQKLRFAYAFMCLFFFLDFLVNIFTGLKLALFNGSNFYVKAFFYIFMNVSLGIWYFWEGCMFLQKTSRQDKIFNKKEENVSKKILTQMSLINSIGMVTFGCAVICVSINTIFGTPWGYFGTFAVMVAILQITSFIQILLFGGVVISPQKLKMKMYALISQSESKDISDSGNKTFSNHKPSMTNKTFSMKKVSAYNIANPNPNSNPGAIFTMPARNSSKPPAQQGNEVDSVKKFGVTSPKSNSGKDQEQVSVGTASEKSVPMSPQRTLAASNPNEAANVPVQNDDETK